MQFNPFNPKTYHVLSYIDRIKLLMLTAMTVGHLAWVLVPTETWLSQFLHFFARMTIPLACFLVVEGFRLTRDVWGYVERLFGFGVLAQIPFAMVNYPLFGETGIVANPLQMLGYGNVLFTLGFGLLTVITLDRIGKAPLFYKPLYLMPIALFMALSTWSDWGVLVIFWVMAIYYAGAWGFVAMSALLFFLSFLSQDNEIFKYVFMLKTQELMDYGVFLTVPIMLWYGKHKANSPKSYRLPRLLFYWYYVGHLLVVAVIYNLVG